MHHGVGGRRSVTRRGAPTAPRRRREAKPHPFHKTASGFESLLPKAGDEDFFFSGWLDDPDEAAEYLEHGGQDTVALHGDPRTGVAVSATLHVLLVLFLLFEPSLEMLGITSPRDDSAVAEESEPPLLVFMDENVPAEPPAVLVPVEPGNEPLQPEPPAVADDRLLIPKALLAPPEEKVQEFMNDLPFSEGNTEEFYTEEEVKEPGEEGETVEEAQEENMLVAESGEDETRTDEAAGEEDGNDGTEVAQKGLGAKELGDLIFGAPKLENERRPRVDIRPPEPRSLPGEEGEGGENGRLTDIRRYLAGAQFHNPEGGLVTNTGNTLYYNDKGANFVPWIRRMLAEVRRNWFVPYAVAFDNGHVAVGITVARDGRVIELNKLIPSGTSGFDNAAVGAIRAAQLLPLPADYPDDRFDIILVFWYNERPYDIFR